RALQFCGGGEGVHGGRLGARLLEHLSEGYRILAVYRVRAADYVEGLVLVNVEGRCLVPVPAWRFPDFQGEPSERLGILEHDQRMDPLVFPERPDARRQLGQGEVEA